MSTFLRATPRPPIGSPPARVVHAVSHPRTAELIAATDAPDLLFRDARTSLPASPRALAIGSHAYYAADALPGEVFLVLVLVEAKVQLYKLPSVEQVEGALADQLAKVSDGAHLLSTDGLGLDLVGESFRVAFANDARVRLVDVNPAQEKVVVLGEYVCPDRISRLAFSEMTIVASTLKSHMMLRVSRGGGLAVAATVPRCEDPGGTAVGDGGAAVLSFFGGLFGRKGEEGEDGTVAFPLPQNRWLLVVDHELVTYSSFGAKLDEMENAFKSRSGMAISETGSVVDEAEVKKGRSKRGSESSFASFATGVSHRTFLDEALAKRPEKPPVDTVFSSPFVFSVTSKNELMVFASNGSIPGVLEQIDLAKDEEKPEQGVRIVATRLNQTLATAYWPSGRVMAVELTDDLDTLINRKEQEGQLRLALALVPADRIDRMMDLRRRLAIEARNQDWHDAAIHHMQTVVNLSAGKEGLNQLDLVAEAVELRGKRDGSWQDDLMSATLWADFLFRLRRRVMRPSPADVDVLETLCRADASASRIKSLLSVVHQVPLAVGESLITSTQSSLRKEERVEALVTLYTSLGAHGKALALLENSDVTNSFDGVVGYLSSSMRASDDPEAFFFHLGWLAQKSGEQAQGHQKLENVLLRVVRDCRESDVLLGRVFEVLVEDAEELLDTVVEELSNTLAMTNKEANLEQNVEDSGNGESSADTFAAALLSGMAKAGMLGKSKVFDKLRSVFDSRVLHNPRAAYHSYTLLQALQAFKSKALYLHEEMAFLLGRQGRYEAAADELAAEQSLGPDDALVRLMRMLPIADKSATAELLTSAYLRVSAKGHAMRTSDAGAILQCAGGVLEVEKLLLDGCCSDGALTLSEMRPFLEAALVSGSERLRLAEMLRALRKSELRRLREEVLTRRRRFVVIGYDRACTLCTRRIGEAVFAAYPDGSVAHLACHVSRENE